LEVETAVSGEFASIGFANGNPIPARNPPWHRVRDHAPLESQSHAAMTMRRVAASFLDAQKSFRKIPGINDLFFSFAGRS